MLIKKQVTEEKIKSIYESSNICASIYDRGNKNLTIIFKNGGQYKYLNVSERDYTRFEIADSQGAVFTSHIKSYSFEKLDKVDVKEILVEVETIKVSEDKIKNDYIIKVMVDSMRDIVRFYDTTGNVESKMFDILKANIDKYESINETQLIK
jgi:hypothetical protein